MIEDVALEMNSSLRKPEVLVGDGTMPYPGNSKMLEDTAGLLGGATHLVHRVEVEVRVTVEMVVVISSKDVLPEVTRLVTGQVVKVV